ncbi:NADH-quinone oxidoreductase subunit M [Helicobacter sp. 13S00401-1]|uniref:NADH-quinone oxidoreductase subunit M n=1 Tax=Helicobacter sp. 13S00401-1 TaxID=1905758 RepID=UPI000BA7C19F|nr:NADH-quinone oxidoreductase subunit M [Helicobacter sp. 13S00401-1]PAF50972.1 NADH-quinone oxidoreductase subunit M [Helicobacter sp. 13S00401-1]
MEYLLTVIVLFPAIASIFIFMMGNNVAKPFGIIIALIELCLVALLWTLFDGSNPGFQFVQNVHIITHLGINYSIGVDGISLFLIALNAVIILLATFYLNQPHEKNHYIVALLWLESILMGLFSSLNMLLFYAFWELSLLPILYIVGVWGTGDRIYAALKFFLYTFAASLIMLVAILYTAYLYKLQFGVWSFNVIDWYHLSLPFSVQIWLFLAFFISIAVKIPIIPFHTWLPYIYTDAPTLGSVILSATLLKMGTYALVRFSLPFFPDASYYFSFPIAILALIMIVYGGFIAFRQKDMKMTIAYSSISHMGIVILGIFAFNVEGIGGSIFLMVAHGIVSGALFFLVGMLWHRRHTRMVDEYSGIASVMPHFSSFFALIMLANVGLPLTVGFVGEFLSLLGYFKTSPVITAIAGTTLIISAIYMLYLYKSVFYGKLKDGACAALKDLNAREYWVLVPIAVLVIFLGVYPNAILKPIETSTHSLITLMKERSVLESTRMHIDKVSLETFNLKPSANNKEVANAVDNKSIAKNNIGASNE